MDARKQKIDADAAWQLIRKHSRVEIGKGKKILSFVPDSDNKDAILGAAMGRSGNLRAPSIVTGDQMIIGFNEEVYERL